MVIGCMKALWSLHTKSLHTTTGPPAFNKIWQCTEVIQKVSSDGFIEKKKIISKPFI
jgi:hypothetical protein